jgi:formylmethanofuran dehydrogenase subunit C
VSARLTLTLRAPVAHGVDLSDLSPDHFAHLDNGESGGQRIRTGGRLVPLGELFDVQGERSEDVVVQGDLTGVEGIGSGMSGGVLRIEGDAGPSVGARMSGGCIDVRGSVGADAGSGMSGGTLRIRGNAGDRLGGASPGAARGMTGGEIVVSGDAGREVAARCRRGLIVIGGTTGPEAGRSMIAGTLVSFGPVGAAPGRFNKRGSIVAIGGIDVPATYRYACTYDPPYVRFLLRYLAQRYETGGDSRALRASRFRRYCGDVPLPGKGEILVAAPQVV